MESVPQPEAADIRAELERILRSSVFQKAKRSQRFLSYLAEAALATPAVCINEYAVALDVFDRPGSYDTAVDATVRVEAGRLRSRLREYYAGEGRGAKVVIHIPKGHYEAEFSCRVTGEPMPSSLVVDQNSCAAPLLATPQVHASATKHESRRASGAGAYRLRIAVALLACLGGTVGFEAFHHGHLEAGSAIHSMAVLPLRNLSGSPDQNYLADGMTDELNAELARVPHLRVISHDSVMNARLTGKSIRQVGKELSVDSVVEGSIFRYGDKVRVTAQLNDVRNDQQLWASSFEGDIKDLISLQDNVAREIANHARLTFVSGPELEGAPTQRHPPEAYDAYLRARYFLDRRDPKLSTEYFQRAIDLDPTFASAYAGLAEALEAALTLGIATPQEVKSRALAAAHRAIELDPRNGPAFSALGTIEFTQLWNWRQAEQDFLRGIELSPGDSFPLTMYGLLLDAANRTDDAIRQMKQATLLDPLSFYVSRNLGSALYYARRYDEALRELDRAKELQPERSQLVDNWISWTYEMKGMRREAVEYDLASLEPKRNAEDVASLRRAYQAGGWRAYWRLRVEQLARQPERECTAYEKAVDYLRLGERELATAQLQQAFNQHCYWMEMIGADPRFDPLRTETHFKVLASRMSAGQ